MSFNVLNMPPDLSAAEAAVFRSRISIALEDLKEHYKGEIPELFVSFGKPMAEIPESGQQKNSSGNEEDTLPAKTLPAVEPKYKFEQLVLSEEILNDIRHKISLFQLRNLVFEEWGLKTIEPYPRSALNFYGPPGTGKTMAAHAIAQFLGKKIILATYAEIESKYHGDGPKNVKAVFQNAEEANAVLFIDEADSLLSQRLSNVTQGSEQAINSMRSQLLICLEKFSGLVIFSTNFVENYDKAFETRVSNIKFEMPDTDSRRKIWQQHLPAQLPLQNDVNLQVLAEEIDDICGRDIKNAVIDAALKVAYAKTHEGRTTPLGMDDLRESVLRIKKARVSKKDSSSGNQEGEPLSEEEKNKIKKRLEIAFETEKEEQNESK